MAKTLNEIIETPCHKGLLAAKIFKVLKGIVSRSGVYRAIKRFRETGSCLPKVRSTPERFVKTKKLIKSIRKKLRCNPQKSTRKLAQEAHVSRSTMQKVLVNNLKVKPYKINKQQLLSDTTKKKRYKRSKMLLNKLLDGTQPQVLWTDKKLFTI